MECDRFTVYPRTRELIEGYLHTWSRRDISKESSCRTIPSANVAIQGTRSYNCIVLDNHRALTHRAQSTHIQYREQEMEM